MSRKKRELTEREWDDVFSFRCRGKRGERLLPEEQALCVAAHAVDPKRYRGMNERIFIETAPFGATVRPTRKASE